MESASAPLKAPRQDRSRRTLGKIVEAARELLLEGGVDAVTVQAVVHKASSSVGSFYARFTGKEDLLRHLDETVWADATERWQEGLGRHDWSALSLEVTVERIVALLLSHGRIDEGERRALAAREGGSEREKAFQATIRDSVRQIILTHQPAIRHPDPAVAADLGLRAVLGALRDLNESSTAAQPTLWDVETEKVAQELVRMYLAYLGAGESEEQPPTGGVDFFDVWA
jgi:AcrR family transcriptional regulator